MLTNQLFIELITSASLAPSADNMQPWEFRKRDDSIEVFLAKSRVLPTDVLQMFGWVGLGAAIQNIIIAAKGKGLETSVKYNSPEKEEELAAVLTFTLSVANDNHSKWIPLRTTNRSPFDPAPLDDEVLKMLSGSVNSIGASVHWNTTSEAKKLLASMDANSTYIRLEHKPLHDELFDILRFTKKEVGAYRYGLTFESLEVPPYAVFFARQLQFWSVNKLVSRLGFDRLVAKQLSVKLMKSGALCLIASQKNNPVGYMEAGRAMEQLWIEATALGLSVQPYGVLPQYLTKVEVEPETFLPKYITLISRHKKPFYSIFPKAVDQHPAIVLRIGKASKQSARSDIRLKPEQLIRQ